MSSSKPIPILTFDDFHGMIFDRSTFGSTFISYDNSRVFQEAYVQSLASEGSGILIDPVENIRVSVRKGNPANGKPTWLFSSWTDSKAGKGKINGNEIGRTVLREKYGFTDIGKYVDPCGKRNFIPIQIRTDTDVNLAPILKQEVPAIVFDRITKRSQAILKALRSWNSKASYVLRWHSCSQIEIDLDVMSPVGEDFGISRDIGYNLSSLVARTYSGYFLDCESHQIPFRDPPIIRSLVQSQKKHLIPCFRADLHDGSELVIYLKERGEQKNLQRIEYRIKNKKLIQDLWGNSFSSLAELQVLLENLYSYVFDRLLMCLNVNYVHLTDSLVAEAEAELRRWHPENCDLLLRALTSNAYLIENNIYPAKEGRINRAARHGIFQKVGPSTKSRLYRLALAFDRQPLKEPQKDCAVETVKEHERIAIPGHVDQCSGEEGV